MSAGRGRERRPLPVRHGRVSVSCGCGGGDGFLLRHVLQPVALNIGGRSIRDDAGAGIFGAEGSALPARCEPPLPVSSSRIWASV